MKALSLILFMFCFISKHAGFGQTQFQCDLRAKESLEMAYIVESIKVNQSVDSLIEWRFSSEYENNILYKYKRGRYAFFKLQKNSKGKFLQSIVYQRQSFQKIIFLDDTLTKYEINNQTRFKVWMSKDRPSIYFCLVEQDSIKIWVFTKDNSVYTSEHVLVE
ncbi:hypothetical protein ACFSKL_06920 [Belliella marina]|uniref:Uncharacterized protein n=1 Tax=Belliella marina TaxID=1644146 RepID=A0ABW4VMN3_9BACT